jgi:CrcB protein
LTLGWGDAPAWTRAVGSGFCGGYTTFSTASVEALRMMQKRRYRAAAADVLGTLVCTVAAAAIGVCAGLSLS